MKIIYLKNKSFVAKQPFCCHLQQLCPHQDMLCYTPVFFANPAYPATFAYS